MKRKKEEVRIAICDDVMADRRAIASALDEYLKLRGLSAAVEEFARPAALLTAVRREPFDLYLLDVLLDDELTGIDLVRLLRGGEARCLPYVGASSLTPQTKDRPPVVFFSTSREYAVDAFAVEAISYLQKPWDRASFARVLDLAMERCRVRMNSLLTFRTNSGVARFDASEIKSVETAATVNYLTIRRARGDACTVRGSIRAFAEQYRAQVRLVPAGRSILVNPAQIAAIEMGSVRFFSGRVHEVPRSVHALLAREILALSAP